MEIIREPRAMREWCLAARCGGASIGFVPTMGALHEGHIALCDRARAENERFVASIFVNPTQFAPTEDLAKYPRPFERDCELLQAAGCDALFAPDADAMYGSEAGPQSWIEVSKLGDRWEGAARPGHLRGVATVVAKLFAACAPTRAYFGEKDFQQLQVVKQLAADLFLDLEIIGSETVREDDGLAMSSRNAYLNHAERKAAQCLSHALLLARGLCATGEKDGLVLTRILRDECERELLASVDYCAVVDEKTLEPLEKIETTARALLAVRIGTTRLIDNMQLTV